MVRTVLLVAAALLLSACTRAPAPDASAAPARPLREIPPAQLTSLMGQLATHVVAIDDLLATGTPADEAARDALWEQLDAMTTLLDALPEDTRDPRHPQFGWRLDTLRRDVRLARTAVGAEPPAYYLVGTITGSCTYCHEARR